MPSVPESLASFFELIDALNCGAVVLERSGRVLHVNARLAAMMDRPAEELLGTGFASLYPAAERERMSRALHEAHEGRENEFYLPRHDGAHLPVMFSGRPLSDAPPLCDYHLFTIIDISRQKAAEARAHEQYQEVCRLSDTVLEQAIDLKGYSERLEQRVRERTRELHEANLDAIYMLAVASEAHDADTGAHVLRIRDYATAVARRLGLSADAAERIGYSAILHDVGKIGVPDAILKKPGPLTPDERRTIELHTVRGEQMLSTRRFFESARHIARSHHENWDGSGYPDHLAGEAVPQAARIVHVVDVFDALSRPRVYKAAWPPTQTMHAIQEGAGRDFDPRIVAAFVDLVTAGELTESGPP
jgi:PAS domain S-box-containing protein